MTDTNGNSLGTMKYYPYGDCRNSQGTIATDQLFTGQRLDGTGLYYYKNQVSRDNLDSGYAETLKPTTISILWSGRYYAPEIGRFISADTIIPNLKNPQSLNRYRYANNNPLSYTDEDGHFGWLVGAIVGAISYTVTKVVVNVIQGNDAFDNWSVTDCLESAVIGGLTSGVGSIGVVKNVLGAATPVVTGMMGSEVQYLLDVHQGETDLSMEGIMESAFLGGIGGAIDIGFGGNTVFRSASVGVVGGTGTGLLGEIFPLEPESINYFDDFIIDTIDDVKPSMEYDYRYFDNFEFYNYYPSY